VKNQQECRERHEELVDDVVAQATSTVDLAGFTDVERTRLARVRRAVLRGERSDAYPVDKRLDFVRWLIEQGKLSDN
jgi:hypothetical protein